MTEEEYKAEKFNIVSARQLGIITAKEALRRLVRLQALRAQQIIEESKMLRRYDND